MEIREATAGDVPDIVALLADDELGRRREEPADPLPDEYRAAFDAISRDPNNLLVVMDDDGTVVGTLQLTLIPYLTFQGGSRAQVEAVRVAAARRGEGLGQQLFEWAIGEAQRRGCHLIQLTTNKGRDDACQFYRSLGFEASHEGMKLYLIGDVHGR